MKIWTYKFLKKCVETAQKYDSVYAECQEWRAKYNALAKDRVTYGNGAITISYRMYEEMIDSLGDKNKDIKKLSETVAEREYEIAHWKEKYANEVQKRLELIERMEE